MQGYVSFDQTVPFFGSPNCQECNPIYVRMFDVVHPIPLRDALQLPPSSAGLPASPSHQGLFMSSVPHHHQQHHYDWPLEEYYAVENLLGMAQFDLPPPATTANRKPSRSSTDNQLLRKLDPPLLDADQSSSSVRTYRVRPQRGDTPMPEHQERELLD